MEKPAKRSSGEAADRASDPQDSAQGPFDASQAEEVVRQAKAGLVEARRLYRHARRRAVGRLRTIRQTTAGDLAAHTLKLVKQYPGPSVVAALFLGFFLGRSTRR